MIPKCEGCGAEFEPYPRVGDLKLNLHGRKRCLECLPVRHLSRPRKRVVRPVRLKACEACEREFPTRIVIDGRSHSLWSRRFCLDCSPFGAHNTSMSPQALDG